MVKQLESSLCPNLSVDCVEQPQYTPSVTLPSQTDIAQITTRPHPAQRALWSDRFFANTWCKTASYQRRACSRYKFAQYKHAGSYHLVLIRLLQGHWTFPPCSVLLYSSGTLLLRQGSSVHPVCFPQYYCSTSAEVVVVTMTKLSSMCLLDTMSVCMTTSVIFFVAKLVWGHVMLGSQIKTVIIFISVKKKTSKQPGYI